MHGVPIPQPRPWPNNQEPLKCEFDKCWCRIPSPTRWEVRLKPLHARVCLYTRSGKPARLQC